VPAVQGQTVSVTREQVAEIVRARGLTHFDEPVRLASGELSQDFIDCKAALSRGPDLTVACRAMIEAVASLGIEFDAVGGLTMGADQLAHGISILASSDWFVVRKEPKNRGTNRLVEGATLGVDTRVLLVDDVVTTGGSIQRAYHAIAAIGAPVVAAAAVVDRGEVARRFFDERNVPYVALVTYRDLGIVPVGIVPVGIVPVGIAPVGGVAVAR
jgi:orotate phosphoribosyltransferase